MADKVNTLSRQPRFSETRGDSGSGSAFFWTFMESLSGRQDAVPHWGQPGRPASLRRVVREEPILSGAVATIVSKAAALDWQIIGGRNRVGRYHALLGEAEDGAGWPMLLDPWLQDYLTVDLGGVLELAREGQNGPVAGLYHLDASRLALTGNVQAPLTYSPSAGKGRPMPLRPLDFSRIVDLRSPDETRRGLGLCAVSRALKASQLLMALYRYEEEQLSDLPPQGVAAVTGLTMAELAEAYDLYETKRKSKEELTFKGVLWLAAQSNPLQQIDVNLTPFSTLPSHWNRNEIVTQYIYVLALDFGVDPREFWPVSQGPLGSGKEAEIQAEKAKGKGFGQLIAKIERAINWDILPAGLEFAFDLRDSEDDLLRVRIQAQFVQNVRQMWEPAMATGAGLITAEEARRLLAEQGVLPEWAGALGDVVIETIAAKAARAELGRGEDLVAINRAGDMTRLWPPRHYSRLASKAGGRRRVNTGVDPLDAQRRQAEDALAAALRAYWAPLAEQLAAWLAANQAALAAAQREQAKEELTQLELPVDWHAEEERLRLALVELLTELWGGALAAAAAEIAALVEQVDWTVFDSLAANLAETWICPKIKDLTAATRQQLGQTIAQWIRSPDDFPTLVERVRRLVPTNPYPRVRDRAQLIAATEVTAIYAESRDAELRAAGLRHSRWVTAQDELVCPICRALGQADDGLGARGDAATGRYLNPDDGQLYTMPGHPGCRCWKTADTRELEEAI